LKPSSYGNGGGYAIWDQGECDSNSPNGCWECLAMYYPNCDSGFEAIGCNVCSPTCPGGMTDIGVSCQKGSYGRTAGQTLNCDSEQQYDAGLCYDPCNAGYDGVGPVCWGACPSGMSQCGALCMTDSSACAGEIMSMCEDVLEAAADLATIEDDPMGAVNSVVKVVKDFDFPVCGSSQ